MPVFFGGAANVGSAEIVDGAIVNADINAAAAIALTKIASLIGNPGGLISIETTTGVTHSLTTVAGQKVLVFVKGDITDGTGLTRTLTTQYNAVTKDTVLSMGGGGATVNPFAMHYTEIPGAATQNITVAASAGTLSNVVIMVIKLQVA